MRISLKKTGYLPAYRKVFGFVLTRKYKVTNQKIITDIYENKTGLKESKFKNFVKKCLEKLFSECDVETKAEFKDRLKKCVDSKILDKF